MKIIGRDNFQKLLYIRNTKQYWSNYVFFVMLIINIDSPPKKKINKNKQLTHKTTNKKTQINFKKKRRKIKHRIF